ncbi:MAG: signal recognition particle-docking protein FtsY [Thermoprotei archaeon]|nr:MAG: signal recognition particle-docking protein FtsY [Thermoprotei archaeon]RLF18615.1 MAG: signal recognition particle-docking protein FtsY [Thermoprotei archaeon]
MFEKLRKSFQSFVESLSTKQLSEEELEEPLQELLFSLVESDVALPVAEELIDRLKKSLVGLKVGRFSDVEDVVKGTLKKTLLDLLRSAEPIDFLGEARKAKENGEVFKVVLVGPNGHGKTLTAAKLAKLLLSNSYTTVLACSDTFRAGAEEQLEEHGRKLGARVVKHRYGADPAAVAFDAVSHAKARGLHAVIVDTAGRLQTDRPLMDEMRKIIRVVTPHLVLFVGDALTGNDALDQAEKFNSAVGINGSILTKLDADAKGGAAVSIIYATKKPILFFGVGQGYDDLIPFSPEWLVERIVAS